MKIKKCDRNYLYATSAMIDYAVLGLINLLWQALTALIEMMTSSFLNTLFCFLLGNCVATAIFIAREECHYWLLGERISIYKSRGRMAKKPDPYDIKTLVKVIVFTTMTLSPLKHMGWLVVERNEWSKEYWIDIYTVSYAMLLMRDLLFMLPFHTLMHSKSSKFRWFRKMHEKHHEADKGAQSLHAYHISILDLAVENGGAPMLMLLVKHLLGLPVHLSLTSLHLFFLHDVGLHSVNPYSTMYFNPILDYFLSPNICHQLHHATKKDFILFTPFHHVMPSLKREDERRYNQTFKTDFTF